MSLTQDEQVQYALMIGGLRSGLVCARGWLTMDIDDSVKVRHALIAVEHELLRHASTVSADGYNTTLTYECGATHRLNVQLDNACPRPKVGDYGCACDPERVRCRVATVVYDFEQASR